MKKLRAFFSAKTAVFCFLFFVPLVMHAQQYDLLIKNGHVIDPKNHINEKKDVAVTNGRIAKVAEDIPGSVSKRLMDASGLCVLQGLIDIHTHVSVGVKP